MRKAFDGFMTEVGKIETYDEDEVESLATFFFKAPRGIQEPTWSRWQSVSTLHSSMHCYFVSFCLTTLLLLLQSSSTTYR